LPKSAGNEVRQNLRKADDENQSTFRQEIESDHAELYQLLTAPDFDRKTFLDKAQDLRTLQDRAKENRDEAFVSSVEHMSQENRQKFADAMEGRKAAKATHKHMSQATTKDDNEDAEESGERFHSLSPSAGGAEDK
jgi:uncharacterized membrane protein